MDLYHYSEPCESTSSDNFGESGGGHKRFGGARSKYAPRFLDTRSVALLWETGQASVVKRRRHRQDVPLQVKEVKNEQENAIGNMFLVYYNKAIHSLLALLCGGMIGTSLVPRLTPIFVLQVWGRARKTGKAWSICVVTNDVHVGQGRHDHDVR